MLIFLLSKKLVLLACSFDLSTSFGGRELNPVLGRGQFGARQAAIGGGLTVGAMLLQRHLEKTHPTDSPSMHRMDAALSAMHVALGASNLYQKTRQ